MEEEEEGGGEEAVVVVEFSGATRHATDTRGVSAASLSGTHDHCKAL